MKTRIIEIQIKSLDDGLNDFVRVAKSITTRKKVEPQKGVYVANVETARSIFTEL